MGQQRSPPSHLSNLISLDILDTSGHDGQPTKPSLWSVFTQALQSRTFFFAYPMLSTLPDSVQSSLILPISVQICFIFSFRTGASLWLSSESSTYAVSVCSWGLEKCTLMRSSVLPNSIMVLSGTISQPFLREKAGWQQKLTKALSVHHRFNRHNPKREVLWKPLLIK